MPVTTTERRSNQSTCRERLGIQRWGNGCNVLNFCGTCWIFQWVGVLAGVASRIWTRSPVNSIAVRAGRMAVPKRGL